MPISISRFYDRLARDYDLIYPDWEAAIASQSRAIDRIIRGLGRTPPLDLLDCACGIGTQSIGLALLGYRLPGTDLSAYAIRRGRRALRLGASASRAGESKVRSFEAEI